MKQKLAILILIVIIVLTLSTFVGCSQSHGYLVEGVYVCENIGQYDGKNIDKITLGVKEITGTEYDKYDDHIIERAEKAYYINYDIWVNGDLIENNYKAYYIFEKKLFIITIEDDEDNIISFRFKTKKEDKSHILEARVWVYNKSQVYRKNILDEEIILKKA